MPDTRLIDYRSVLSAKGEVAIGLLVRKTRRKRVLIALSGALLIGVAGLLAWWLWPPRVSSPGTTSLVCLRCVSCQFETTERLHSGQRFPLKCTKCGAHALRELWICRAENCGFGFVPEPSGTQRVCPKCRSADVGSYAAARPGATPTTTAPAGAP
ncbi:MAG: hypothetical protein JNG88_00575 [Phycisphaerales bacterium]|nr:hypothetical protein [Phycisphaerales bacterium]